LFVQIAIVQLSNRDMANRRISSEELLEMLNHDGVISTAITTYGIISTVLMTDDGVISTALMTDEAQLRFSDDMNEQNHRYWAPENPQNSISVLSTAKD
jgi:hypothetical protein